MTAGSRLGLAIALTLAGQSALHAQETPPAAEPPAPANQVVGNPQLQDFSLGGTVTRRAETEAAPAPAQRPAANRPPPAETAAPAATDTRLASGPSAAARPQPVERQTPAEVSRSAPEPAQRTGRLDMPLGALPSPAELPTEVAADPEPVFAPADPEPALATSTSQLGMWPWIVALLAAAGAAAYYFHRHRPRHALAGFAFDSGPATDLAPSPAPAPAPQPRQPLAPPPRPASTGGGIVSTRLRPWLEVDILPGRCILTGEGVTIECDIALYNSGAAPARDVRLDGRIVNAGPTQDQDIAALFAYPEAKAGRIALIEPLKRVDTKMIVRLPAADLRLFEANGRRFFIPLLALTALYRAGSQDGQTSAAWLLGREKKGAEKLAPFGADLGERTFRGLAVRPLEVKVRK